MPLSAVFINLTKTFDPINKKALWTVHEQIGFPEVCKDHLPLSWWHDWMGVLNGNMTEPFDISNSMKQGCILAPVVFNISICMLTCNLKSRGRNLPSISSRWLFFFLFITLVPKQSLFNISYRGPSSMTIFILMENLNCSWCLIDSP